jgi:hypothetical protein
LIGGSQAATTTTTGSYGWICIYFHDQVSHSSIREIPATGGTTGEFRSKLQMAVNRSAAFRAQAFVIDWSPWKRRLARNVTVYIPPNIYLIDIPAHPSV